MEASELESGIDALELLSQEEYRQGLSEILARPGTAQGESLLRIGRLVGVELKEPFANYRTLDEPSSYSAAYREWTVAPAEDLDEPSLERTWQYQTVELFRQEEIDEGTWQHDWGTTLDFVAYVPGERGFFGYLARSFKRYICRDSKLQQEVESNIEQARKSGYDVKDPRTIVGAGGLTLGALLIQSVPALGLLGAPAIAGLILVLYSVGADAFCDWAESIADSRGSEDLKVAPAHDPQPPH